jgi:hypothetical protein
MIDMYLSGTGICMPSCGRNNAVRQTSACTIVSSVEYKSSEFYGNAVYLVAMMDHIYSGNYAPVFIRALLGDNSLPIRASAKSTTLVFNGMILYRQKTFILVE